MAQRIRILGTGVRVDLHPDPEPYLGREHRVELARWHAGEVVFVRLTSFAEFDDESGTQQRWEGTPQGPFAVPVTSSATSTLLGLVDVIDQPVLADFGISGMPVSRFDFHAAPRRIDVDPAVASRLKLD